MKKLLVLFFVILSVLTSSAQIPGANDFNFNVGDAGFNLGSRYSTDGILVQPDDKILIRTSTSLVRLNYDGTPDSTFSIYYAANDSREGSVNFDIQPDNKIVFISKTGSTFRLIRLWPDGTVDNSFDTNFVFNALVYEIKIQPDGKILAGGNFNTFDGFLTPGLVRINSNGTRDTTFNIGLGFNQATSYGYVHSIDLESSGSIVTGGKFSSYNGITKNNIVRLLPDGTIDPSYNFGTGFNGEVHDLIIQPDGRIIIAGDFWFYNGTAISRSVTRINNDGSLDSTFNQVGVPSGGWVTCLALHSNGKIVIAGGFSNYDNTPVQQFARLDTNGDLDLSFVSQGFYTTYFNDIAIQNDGKYLVGSFVNFHYGDMGRNGLLRLEADGAPDHSFFQGSGFNNTVRDIKIDTDGSIMVAGEFSNFNNHSTFGIARLFPDGTADTSFRQLLDIDAFSSIAIQPDHKIVALGLFNNQNPYAYGVGRLLPNGQFDPTFNTPFGLHLGNQSYDIELLPDGKILAVGSHALGFRVVRLESNGALDTSYHGGIFDQVPYKMILLPDNRTIVIGGFAFIYFGGDSLSVNGLAMVLPNGNPDTTFNLYGIPSLVKKDIIRQPDGKFITSQYTYGVKRLLPNGNNDSTFNAASVGGIVEELLLQPDGKILVGGNISCPSGNNCTGLQRLNPNGTIDTSLQTGTGYLPLNTNLEPVRTIALQNNWQILSGGSFTSYNNIGRNRINRIAATDTLCAVPPFNVVSVSGSNQVCSGENISLSRVGGTIPSGGTVEWYSGICGGIYLGSGDTISVNPIVSTTYYVRVEASCGNSVCAQFYVEVISINPAVIIGDSTICTGNSTVLSLSSTYDFYTWSNGANTPNITVSTTGIFTVIVSNTNGCSASDSFTVTAASPYTTILSASGPLGICQGDSVMLSAIPGQITYQWLRNNLPLPGAVQSDLWVNTPGLYRCESTDSTGCTGTSNFLRIRIVCMPPFDPEERLTNIPSELEVFPNPASGYITINIPVTRNQNMQLKVIDLNGKVVLHAAINQPHIELSLQNISSGIYFLEVNSDNQVFHQKIMVQ